MDKIYEILRPFDAPTLGNGESGEINIHFGDDMDTPRVAMIKAEIDALIQVGCLKEKNG